MPLNDGPAGLVVLDDGGRAITPECLTLIDWEGYIANPAVRFYLVPPPGAAFPAKAVLSASESRLHFDLPSEVGRDGPQKNSSGRSTKSCPCISRFFLTATARDEGHRLRIDFSDARGATASLSLPDPRDRSGSKSSQCVFDHGRFFAGPDRLLSGREEAGHCNPGGQRLGLLLRRHEAAAGRGKGTEKTLIWGSDGFKTSTTVTNEQEYQGYLLYAYGIRNELLPSDSAFALRLRKSSMKRDSARMIRSGGEPSPYGGFQIARGKQKPIRRSGGLEIEVQGNYNTLGWLVTLSDGEWWKAANLGDAAADLYSIAHHEIGHASDLQSEQFLDQARRDPERRTDAVPISAAFRL